MQLIAVLDFGGQYSHLITRRIRECEVYSELLPYSTTSEDLLKLGAKGIILSGGPASVYEEEAPRCDPRIFKLGLPVLGICYGLQLMVDILGGHVKSTTRSEYGKSSLNVLDHSDLFRAVPSEFVTWMSHGDYADSLPKQFEIIGTSVNCNTAAIRNSASRYYGVQFHPEVAHTDHGTQIIRNFVQSICGCSPTWTARSIIDTAVSKSGHQ